MTKIANLNGKPAWKSLGILGGLMALAPVIDKVLDQTGVLPGGVLGDLMSATTGFVGAMAAIYGRLRAQVKITKLF